MLLCTATLIGTTFAWFTDSVTSGQNKIVVGNLDVELEYKNSTGTYQTVTNTTSLFDDAALWEPGHTDKLSDYLVLGQAAGNSETTYATREEVWAAAGSQRGLTAYSDLQTLVCQEEKYVALVVYMPTDVDNEANYRGDAIPTIDLGISLVATQAKQGSDSFGSTYDAQAATDENMRLIELEAQGWNLVNSAGDIVGDGKYVLTEDIANAVALTAADNAVLDLNGKTMHQLTVNGNVTLIDSSDEKFGAITANHIIVGKGSTLTIEAGTYKGNNPTETAEVIVNGGTITGQSYGNKAAWTINGGHFSSTGILFSVTQGETITINDGTFDGMVNFGSKAYPATVIINGGTFNSDVSATCETWNIHNGIFNGPVYASVSTGYVYATCSIAGGTFNHIGISAVTGTVTICSTETHLLPATTMVGIQLLAAALKQVLQAI